MAEQFHDHAGVHALGQQEGGCGVPAVVQPHVPNAGLAQQGAPVVVVDLLVDRSTVRLGEDEVLVVPFVRSEPSGTPTWLAQSSAGTSTASGYDDYGRAVNVADSRGNRTTTAYTPATGGPVTQVARTTTVAGATFGTATTVVEPSWGKPSYTVDVNGHRTEANRDALGRVVAVWYPNHLKASYPTQPNATYSYSLHASGGDNSVATSVLGANNVYVTTYQLYDGLARLRQTQSVSAANGNVGTVFAHIKYDAEGRPTRQMRTFDASVQPSTTLFSIADWQAHDQTATQYDRAGRVTAQIAMDNATELWRTTTTYGGDRINVTPPAPGTATTTLTDARGHTTALRRYLNRSDVGSDTRNLYDLTTYHYDKRGQQDKLTDNGGNAWTYAYDLLGRQTHQHGPDEGDVDRTYNDFGDVLTSTDSRSPAQVLAYVYDGLGRKTEEHSGSSSGPMLASWTYDPSGGKGQIATTNRYVGSNTYTTKVLAYNSLDKPAAVQYTIPASQTGLAGTYQYSYTYRVDGSLATVGIPAAGGLSGETLTYTYQDATDLPEQLQTNAGGATYVTNTDYTAYGELSFVQYQQAQGNWLQRQYLYDEPTRRLKEVTTTRQVSPQIIDDTKYSYDAVGDLTSSVQTSALFSTADNQCFNYDYAQRLRAAWTPASGDCTAAPSATTLGGPAPYWESWTFDPAGDRQTQTTHSASGDTVATSTPSATQPHAIQSIAVSGPGGTSSATYAYDAAGDTISRPGPGGQQTLNWDAEGHLATLTGAGVGTNTYTYDADGARLISDTPASTTAYLPFQEVSRSNATGALTATRYYTWGGQTVASRTTGQAPTWLITDRQGTAAEAVQSSNQSVSTRRQDPYGNPRGAAPTGWTNRHGYVDGSSDPTGLTHLGAREYDSSTGRFVSVDPVLLSSNVASLNGYSYADNDPIDRSDPSGLCSWAWYICQGEQNTPANDNCNGCFNGEGAPTGTPDDMTTGNDPNWAPPAPAAAGSSNRTGEHNAARDAAITKLEQVYGLNPDGFITSLRVPGAAKRCMSLDAGCSYGMPDIVYQDPVTGQFLIWEVKAASIAPSALIEAMYYMRWMNKNGLPTKLGGTFAGTGYTYGGADGVVAGPVAGTAIYGHQPKEPPGTPDLVPQRVPVPQPQAAPGPRGTLVGPDGAPYAPAPPRVIAVDPSSGGGGFRVPGWLGPVAGSLAILGGIAACATGAGCVAGAGLIGGGAALAGS